jgi:hypothetical protein
MSSGSVGNGRSVSRFFSIIRHVVSSTAVTLRSLGAKTLRLLYRLLLADGLNGVFGVGNASVRGGDDGISCESDDDGCGLPR